MILSRQLFSVRRQCWRAFAAVFPTRLRSDVDVVAGLTNRERFGYVERVSWFSEFSFGSFPVGSYVPAAHEVQLQAAMRIASNGELGMLTEWR